ncbi:MAG: hypothetical protein UY48_C0013G0008 [Candidatus Gottesmanbacteria bacterium GW2011_GWB1_49_7]|uniref:Uncharacterized protein n=1 Tax=Candidatus Gottesmanbacteria bacterium GW2011_GWB1_49_7 TaxID=1618448 RepID=A0A0G1Y9Z9_9BACT|nr:MAG: hypothetical protein UY48_C0013G0008 [Candidatus Gottesmanbacteria bacterium GW2011_GWB1_49_7]
MIAMATRAVCSGDVFDTINNDNLIQHFIGKPPKTGSMNDFKTVFAKAKAMRKKYPYPRYSIEIKCDITKE